MAKELARLGRPVATFYRGVTSNCVASVVSWAIFWPAKNIASEQVLSWKSDPASSEKVKPTKTDTFLITCLTGMVIQVAANPLWVVKTRMLGVPRGAEKAPSDTMAAVVGIWRNEGYKGFYSGLFISSFGIAQAGLHFVIYDHAKDWYMERKRLAFNTADHSPGDQPSRVRNLEIALFASFGKAISNFAFYPYQVIRTRQQMLDARRLYGEGMRSVAKGLYKEGGVRAFYKGVGPAIVRNLPATCVTFLAYETLFPMLTRIFRGDKSGDAGRHEP